MATTFHVTNFKNVVLDWLTGRSSTAAYPIYYINFYNGAQPADPSTTPVGSAEFASVANGPYLVGKFTAADNNGVGFLNASTGPSSASGAASVASLTFARAYNNSSNATMDIPIGTTASAGVGMVVDSLSSSAGVGTTITTFSIKMPRNNGGTLWLSLSLAKRLVDLVTNVISASTANIPQMGINTNGACTLTVYSGSVPADADTPITTQTALCTFSVGASNIWAAATGGSAGMSITLSSSAALATGTATFARLVKTNGSMTYTIQGSAGAAGSDFVIGTTSIVAGNTYTLTDAVITL